MKLKPSDKGKKQVASQQMVKESNYTLIFNLIYKYSPISRAELAQATKLSPTTVSSLVEELIRNGLVVEIGAGSTTTSGRKPIMLEISSCGGFIIAVEMTEDGFTCFLYDMWCKAVAGGSYKTKEYAFIGDDIAAAVEELLTCNRISKDKLLGICVGIPGLIDYENNKVVSSTVIPINRQNDFYIRIRKSFADTPVIVENESNLCAYAEKEFGTAEDIQNIVFINYITTGIGGGIILEGSVYRGTTGLSGEIGHITIDMNGPRCKCGNRGCLEVMAGIPAIIQKLIFGIMSGRETAVSGIIGNDFNRINMDVVRTAIEKGDPLTLEVLDEIAERLAFGINNIINLYSPQAIIIGGEIRKAGEAFLRKLQERLQYIELEPNVGRIQIRYSGLGENIAALGGARYVLDNRFNVNKF